MRPLLRLQSRRALAARYGRAFSQAWAQRRALAAPGLRGDEAEFLPAVLALQAAPVSPVGRLVGRLLMALVAAASAWAVFGRIDIVVGAAGRIVPSARTKTISSMEVGVVRAVHVVDGQRVKAGDPLVELDARSSDSERDRAEVDLRAAQLQAARSRAMLAALDGDARPALGASPGVDAPGRADAQRQLDDQWRDFAARRDRLAQDIARYADALPLAARRARDYAALLQDHDVSAHAWSEKEQARIDLEGQLRDAHAQLVALRADARRSARESLAEAERQQGDAAQDARRARVHGELLTLRSPVDGTVQQLEVHTLGAAVPAAQPLMAIVPAGGPVEVEAMLDNKDVGFVQEGQEAQVKIDAFPYTRYGSVPARVVHVSRDAVKDDKRGWLYAVTLRLERPTLAVDGRAAPLAPGMTTAVDIRTGTRRVVEYVLSPLLEHAQESLHER
jgi:hemolysin D